MLLAHSGHWLANLAFTAPVVLIVVWISVRAIMDRRRGKPPSEEDS